MNTLKGGWMSMCSNIILHKQNLSSEWAHFCLKGASGIKSLTEQLKMTASLFKWFKLYFVGEFELSACPINPLDTSNLTASSD